MPKPGGDGKRPGKRPEKKLGLAERFIRLQQDLSRMESEAFSTVETAKKLESARNYAAAARAWETALMKFSTFHSKLDEALQRASKEEQEMLRFRRAALNEMRVNAARNYSLAGDALSARILFFQTLSRNPAPHEATEVRKGIAAIIASPFLKVSPADRIETIYNIRAMGLAFETGIVDALRSIGIKTAPGMPPGAVLNTIREQIERSAGIGKPVPKPAVPTAAPAAAKPPKPAIPAVPPAAAKPLVHARPAKPEVPKVAPAAARPPAPKPTAPPLKPPAAAKPVPAAPERRKYAKPAVLRAEAEAVPRELMPGFVRKSAEQLFKLGRGKEAIKALAGANMLGDVTRRFYNPDYRKAVVDFLMENPKYISLIETRYEIEFKRSGVVAAAVEVERQRRAAEAKAEAERKIRVAALAAVERRAKEQIKRGEYHSAVATLLTGGAYNWVIAILERPEGVAIAPYAAEALRSDKRWLLRLSKHLAESRNIPLQEAFRSVKNRVDTVLRKPLAPKEIERAKRRKAARPVITYPEYKAERVKAARLIAEAKRKRIEAARAPQAMAARINELRGERRLRYIDWLIREQNWDVLVRCIQTLSIPERVGYIGLLLQKKAFKVVALAHSQPQLRAEIELHMLFRPAQEINAVAGALSLERKSSFEDERRLLYNSIAETGLRHATARGFVQREFNAAFAKLAEIGNRKRIAELFFSKELPKQTADAIHAAVAQLSGERRITAYTEIKNLLVGEALARAVGAGREITRAEALDEVDAVLDPQAYKQRQIERIQRFVAGAKLTLSPLEQRLVEQGRKLASEIAAMRDPARAGSLSALYRRLDAAIGARVEEHEVRVNELEQKLLRNAMAYEAEKKVLSGRIGFEDGVGIDKREHPYRFLAEVFMHRNDFERGAILRDLVLLSETSVGRAQAKRHLAGMKEVLAELLGGVEGAPKAVREKASREASKAVELTFEREAAQINLLKELISFGVEYEKGRSLVVADLKKAKQTISALKRKRIAEAVAKKAAVAKERAAKRAIAVGKGIAVVGRGVAAGVAVSGKALARGAALAGKKALAAKEITAERAALAGVKLKKLRPRPIKAAMAVLERRRARIAAEKAEAAAAEAEAGVEAVPEAPPEERAFAKVRRRIKKPFAAAGVAVGRAAKAPFAKAAGLFPRWGLKRDIKKLSTEAGRRRYVEGVVSLGADEIGKRRFEAVRTLYEGAYKPLSSLEESSRAVAEAHDLSLRGLHKEAAEKYIDAGRKAAARREADALIHEGAAIGGEAKKLGIGMFQEAAQLYERVELPERAAMAYEKCGDYENAMRQWSSAGRHEEVARLLELNEKYFEAGEAYINAGNSSQAVRVAKKLMDGGSYDKAGEIFSRLGRYKKAAKAYRRADLPIKAAEVYRNVPDYKSVKRLAKRLRKNRRDHEAIKILKSVGLHSDAAKIHERHGDYHEAAQSYHLAGEFVKEAECRALVNEYEEAARIYESQKMPKEAGRVQGDNAVFLQGLADEWHAASIAEAEIAKRMEERGQEGFEEYAARARGHMAEAERLERSAKIAFDEAARLYKKAESLNEYLRCVELSGNPEKALRIQGLI